MEGKNKKLLLFCTAFLGGVAFASVVGYPEFQTLLVSFFILLFFSISFWNHKILQLIFLASLFFLLGIARYTFAFPNLTSLPKEPQTFTAYISAEPDVRIDGVRYIVRRNKIQETRYKREKYYIKTELYPRYSYGDELHITCRLERPEPIEDFRYDMYLARFGVFALCKNPKIEKIGEGESKGEGKGGVILYRGIFKLKDHIAERVNQLWHEPHASFMAGLLYGYRGGLGELNDLFNKTGVTHIVAISGYNITIIATILSTLCVHILIPRKKAFWFVVSQIALFVIFAGMSASVVRAGIMGIITLLAKQMGRLSRVGGVLLLSAVIMTLANPFILIWDAGFQLSFLSTVGLVYMTPIIEPRFSKLPDFLGIRESFVSTIAATLATLPLILSQFGRLSIVSVVVNVLILWMIPVMMGVGFFAVLGSFIFKPIGIVLAWVGWLGLSYIILIVKWFAALPFASVQFSFSPVMMVLTYVMMAWLIVRATKKSLKIKKSPFNEY